jgi:hypothetical protein
MQAGGLDGTGVAFSQKSVAPFEFSDVPQDMVEQLSGRTAIFFHRSHGIQVEYFDPNGSAHLWYPGNSRGVESQWKVDPPRSERGATMMCFRYPESSYNLVTKRRGGDWECRPNVVFASSMVGLVAGDPFNLVSGKVPAVLPKGKKLSIRQLKGIAGYSALLEFIYLRR